MANSKLSDSDNSSSDEYPECIATEEKQELGAVATVSDSSIAFADEEQAIAFPPQVSPHNSLVIQSLIKFICKKYTYPSCDTMYREFCEMLYRMMIIDHSFKMVEFEGLRMQYESIFQQIFSSAPGTRSGAVSPVIDSHYEREFEEKGFIARGGFGKVYRVRHRLDGTEYAIKKICIRNSSIKPIQDCLSEVKTFASMNHPNILQYKGAWIEMNTRSGCDTDTDTDTETDDEDALEGDSFGSNGSASTDFNVYFETSRHHSLSTSRDKKAKNRIKRNSASEGGDAICKVEEIKRLQGKQVNCSLKWATLYIQMTLCHSTLKDWLDDRNLKESSGANGVVPVCDPLRARTVIGICRQILSGLDYMHAKQMVHHDIKPSNIFILHDMQSSTLIQLGDFGLACPKNALQHQLARGTQLYAAPEQLAGVCDPKSDMYSLGIVILELTEDFSTNMERVEYIRHLRNGIVPEMTQKHHPLLAKTMSRLVVREPESRPDAATLIKELKLDESKEDKDSVIARQARELQEMRLRIAELEQELQKTKEILGDRS